MAEHRIELRLVDDGHAEKVVLANQNPLRATMGDTVSLDLDAEMTSQLMRVVFTEVRRLPDDGTDAALLPENAAAVTAGPFATPGTTGGTVVKGPGKRFVYKVVRRDGTQVEWATRSLLDGKRNFGGIDIPSPPGG